MRVHVSLITAGLALAAAATGAIAQDRISPNYGGDRGDHGRDRAEAIIYRDSGFSGPAVNVSRAESNMRLSWGVGSIRIRSGTWELCQLPDFRGRCTTYDRDSPGIAPVLRNIQSLRPVGGDDGDWGSGGGPRPPGPSNPGPSLKGMASEFFTRPAEYGQRVIACSRGPASAGCAQQTAQQFCRAQGYSGAGYSSMETQGRQVYLADVLCTRSGR